MAVDVAILGSTGYTGKELLKLLQGHSKFKPVFLGSEQYAGQKYSEIYPEFTGIYDIELQKTNIEKLRKCGLVFFATPNGICHKLAPELIGAGINIVDLSADYRFRDLETYSNWYGFEREDKELNANAIYGLVEFKRNEIQEVISKAKAAGQGALIGNPGCYTTASILALAPVLKQHAKDIDPKSIIIDAKSGISGAGRKASTATLYSELNDSISAYNLANKHRHTPELEAFFSEISGQEVLLSFSPHLTPMTKGILATCYINFSSKVKLNYLRELYKDIYKDEPFVQVLEEDVQPKSAWTCNTNRCLIQLELDERLNRLIVTSAIDNLGKGAAGQALHNANLIYGFDEKLGLQ